jgi:integrase
MNLLNYANAELTSARRSLSQLQQSKGPGELRQAEWPEFDLAAAEWRIPGERMKAGEPHLVPLSTQAVEILKWLQPITGRGRYLFPSLRTATRPISTTRRMRHSVGLDTPASK